MQTIGENHLDAEAVPSIPNREESPGPAGIDEGEICEVENHPVNVVSRQQVLKRCLELSPAIMSSSPTTATSSDST